MTTSSIDATKTSLQQMLKEIKSGNIQLPDFQREWIWQDSQIKSLLASVSMGIPIGSLLTLEADERLEPRLFDGVPEPACPTIPKMLVLDGQQRLTALYQSCHSQLPVATMSRKRLVERDYYFDMKKCIDENIDREECVFSEALGASQSKDSKIQYCNDLFPTAQIFKFREWYAEYLEHHNNDASKRDLARKFEDTVVENFRMYHLPNIRMVGTDLDAISITFEKTNDRGTRLSGFDILTAKMRRENFNLKEDWNQQKDSIIAEPVLKRVDETHYLKAITLLVTNAGQSNISARRKDMLNLSSKDYKSYSSKVTEGFLTAAGQLREFGINTSKQLVNVPHTIVMAAIYAHCQRRQTDTVTARGVFKRWYWTTLLNESYGSRITDQQMASDFSDLVKRLTGQNVQEDTVFSGRPFNSARLLTEKQKSLTIAVQALLAKENRPLDWITGRPMEGDRESEAELHHIFPRKWCNDNGIDEGQKESVANLTLIDLETNKIIGSKAPSVYLKDLQEKAGNITDEEMDKILESHLIPAKELRQNDFSAFHKERAENLKNMIASIIGSERIA